MCTLSIITPTYNRAAYLERCFQSLQRQTCMDFEWIIVDDGSSDNTAEVVSAFRPEQFTLQFVQKKNGGKHTALNASHPYIHGKYVLILDSDDYLTDTAVEEVLVAWAKYEQNEKIGVVTFLRGTPDLKPLCVVDDYDQPVDLMRYKRHRIVSSDCCEVIRTDLFKRYPFPEYANERFVAECALWNRVSFTHECIYRNSVIYICEYLAGGLTDSGRKMRVRNPKGGLFTSNLRMDRKNFFLQRVKYGLLYSCYGFFANMPVSKLIRDSCAPLLTVSCLPGGYIIYRRWKRVFLIED